MLVIETGQTVYVCSNKACDAVWAVDPQGHCPRCKRASGAGWSTMHRRVLSTTPITLRPRLSREARLKVEEFADAARVSRTKSDSALAAALEFLLEQDGKP